METIRTSLEQLICEHVARWAQNGIKQHDPAWLDAKVYTIGGSSLATIQGKNPYKKCAALIGEKIGLIPFRGDIKMQWGTLFEHVIKRYTEHDKNCTVYGDDLYIEGPQHTAYSPDGLAVMEITRGQFTIVLCEFKCPYSRLPAAKPPAYYVPQVKMGLDILRLPSVGLLVEGVFRRCAWDQLDNTTQCDSTLVGSAFTTAPLALGIIGFYFDGSRANESTLTDVKSLYEQLCRNSEEYFEDTWGESHNVDLSASTPNTGEQAGDIECIDLGGAAPKVFTNVMSAIDKKLLVPYYCPLVTGVHNEFILALNSHLAQFTQFCKQHQYINFGILPWKLFQVKYSFIEKEADYLTPWLPKIAETINLVKQCNEPSNASIKLNLYNSYISRTMGGFSDE